MNDTARIEEAITEHWGERCPDHMPGCPICDSWAELDMLVKPSAVRAATEDDVIAAVEVASFGNWPQDPADLLEFYNRMLDLKLGEGASEDE